MLRQGGGGARISRAAQGSRPGAPGFGCHAGAGARRQHRRAQGAAAGADSPPQARQPASRAGRGHRCGLTTQAAAPRPTHRRLACLNAAGGRRGCRGPRTGPSAGGAACSGRCCGELEVVGLVWDPQRPAARLGPPGGMFGGVERRRKPAVVSCGPCREGAGMRPPLWKNASDAAK